MHLMRYVGELEEDTLEYPCEIQNVEADSDEQITVYCSDGWYFTLTRQDVEWIVAVWEKGQKS